MRIQYTALVTLTLIAGCNGKAREAREAAAAQSARNTEIDERAKAVAQDLINQAKVEADKKQEAEARQKAAALEQVHQAAMDHPANFLEASNVDVTDDGKRHLTSISVLNKSQFSMSDIHGTVDFHGAVGDGGADGDVMARVPIQLVGSIAPGASMVFTEQLHTLVGTSIRLQSAPVQVTFTITRAKVGLEGMDTTPSPVATDGGVKVGAAL